MIQVRQELQRVLDTYLNPMAESIVLEAGCGSGSKISLPTNTHVVGIDISQEELDKNSVVDEKIVGDIQTYDLPDDNFDLIVCWDVLEHLAAPELALDHFATAVKPGGLLLLAFPNVYSTKGLVAKITPHWFHVFVYRRIYGSRYGGPGRITFPTYLRKTISPDSITKYAASRNFEILYEKLYESSVQEKFRRKYHITSWRLSFVRFMSRLLTFGRYGLDESDCVYLMRRDTAK